MINTEEALDRFTQLTDLLIAARIPADTATAAACWQVAFNIFYSAGVPEETLKAWISGWYQIRRENELNQEKILEKTTDFMEGVLKKQEQDKES